MSEPPDPGDTLTLRRVANGWVIEPGRGQTNAFIHVAKTPKELAEHVELWASIQQDFKR